MSYLLFKFIHIVAAVSWIGCLAAVSILTLRLATTTERPVLQALARQSEFIGTRVLGPSAGLTLLAGFALVWVGHVGFPLWVILGLGGFVVVMGLGGALVRRAGVDLAQRLATGDSAATEIAALQRRVGTLQATMVLLLVVVVWVMVFKPAL